MGRMGGFVSRGERVHRHLDVLILFGELFVILLTEVCLGRQASLCCGGWKYFPAKWQMYQHCSQTPFVLNLSSATYQLGTLAVFFTLENESFVYSDFFIPSAQRK